MAKETRGKKIMNKIDDYPKIEILKQKLKQYYEKCSLAEQFVLLEALRSLAFNLEGTDELDDLDDYEFLEEKD
jgi:hypothetical protein